MPQSCIPESHVRSFPVRVSLVHALVGTFGALLMLLTCSAGPSSANISPESAYIVHVQSAGAAPSCVPAVASCSDIVRQIASNGPTEFQLFFYPAEYVEDHLPLPGVNVKLRWPESWTLLDWTPCSGGIGSLEPEGSNYRLELSFPECPIIEGQLLLLASFVLSVDEGGAFGFPDFGYYTWLGCPPDGFESISRCAGAWAGTDCEYSRVLCAQNEHCTPVLTSTKLLLTAPEGGSIEGTIPFTAYSAVGPIHPCALSTTAGAPWASPTIVAGTYPNYTLTVDCDAANLTPGWYETWVQVNHENRITRCVQVQLEVTSTTGVEDSPSPTARRTTWGGIKSQHR